MLDYNPETGVLIWKNGIMRCGYVWGKGRVAGCMHRKYRVINIYGKQYLTHRVAWFHFYGKWPRRQIDHINGNPIDNRIVNLRDVSARINQQNLKKATKYSKTGLLGASPAGKTFLSIIRLRNGIKYLGKYKTAMEAHRVYLDAKRKYHRGCTI